MVNEDPFPPLASVNIAATNLRLGLNEKNDEKFSLNVRIRNVWIPKQCLVHKDELIVKGKVYTTREKEKNGTYPYHSKQEIKKKKPSIEKNVSPKRDILFQW